MTPAILRPVGMIPQTRLQRSLDRGTPPVPEKHRESVERLIALYGDLRILAADSLPSLAETEELLARVWQFYDESGWKGFDLWVELEDLRKQLRSD